MKILLLENDRKDYNNSRKWVVRKLTSDSYDVTVLIKNEKDGFQFDLSIGGLFVGLFSIYNNRELFKRTDIIIAYRIESIVYTWLCSFFFPRNKIVYYFTGLGREVNNDEPSKALRLFFWLLNIFSGDSVAIFQNEEDKRLSKFQRSFVVKGSAVDENEYFYRGEKMPKKIIVYPSRLIKSKGIIQFAEIFSDHVISNSYELHVYGNMNILDKDRLEQEDLNHLRALRAVEFKGQCDNLKDVYSQVAFCALNSFYGEGTPRTLLESMRMGLPIIAKKNRGVNHLFNCDNTLSPGYYYSSESDLKKCFSQIMNITTQEYRCKSSYAMTTYNQYFSQEIVYQGLKNILNNL